MAYTPVTAQEITELEGLDDWRVVLGELRATFTAPSYPAGGALVAAIADAAEAADHHPDLEMGWPGRIGVRLSTHAIGGLSTHDVDLARTISALAREAGATADPHAARDLEVAIDALDIDAVRPFWAAVLDYREQDDGSLAPRAGSGAPVWFQQMDAPRPQRNRIHLDVWVPHDIAEQRLDAALAAGGVLVRDDEAPSFWVLADPEGNEACICTWQDRA